MSSDRDEASDSQPQMTRAEDLPADAVAVEAARLAAGRYRYTYTTGPFALPSNAQSIDWLALNNDVNPQTIRVTVFKCAIGQVKTAEPPGPLDITVGPGETTHNANAAIGGFVYEIQIQTNSRLVFPGANAWPSQASNPLPASVVKSAEFIRRMQ